MLNYQNQQKTTKISAMSEWLIKNKIVKNDKDAQALLGLILIIIVFTLYWFFFIKPSPAPIDRALIEKAGSPEEIINS